jgi:hypothetical protein
MMAITSDSSSLRKEATIFSVKLVPVPCGVGLPQTSCPAIAVSILLSCVDEPFAHGSPCGKRVRWSSL